MATKKATTKTGKTSTTTGEKYTGLTKEEISAMKDRVKELKAETSRSPRSAKADGESDVLAKIGEMSGTDRTLAKRFHAIVRASAPDLSPKLWYGMPAYARDGKIVCFFQSAAKFNARDAMFGFNDTANLDEGAMWPTSYALKDLTPAEEEKISALVKKAVR